MNRTHNFQFQQNYVRTYSAIKRLPISALSVTINSFLTRKFLSSTREKEKKIGDLFLIIQKFTFKAYCKDSLVVCSAVMIVIRIVYSIEHENELCKDSFDQNTIVKIEYSYSRI